MQAQQEVVGVADLNMTEEFRVGCERLGITEAMLQAAMERSSLAPAELLTIDHTTSSRNFRISYLNKAGEKKWSHIFVVVSPASSA